MASIDVYSVCEVFTAAITSWIEVLWKKEKNVLHFYAAEYDANVFRRYDRHYKAIKRILAEKDHETAQHPKMYISCYDEIKTSSYDMLSKLAIRKLDVNPVDLKISTPIVIIHFVISQDSRSAKEEIEKVLHTFVQNVIQWTIFIFPHKIDVDIDTSGGSKFSCVPKEDTSAVWNHITSALELRILQVLSTLDSPSLALEVKALTNRVKKCSAIKPIVKPFPKKIPPPVQTVLDRYSTGIYRYGFMYNRIEVFVDKNLKPDISKEIENIKPKDCPWNIDILEGNGSLQQFSGDHFQGNKLYGEKNIKLENDKYLITEDIYGTLGCTALANESVLVAVTCNHVCVKGSEVFTYCNGHCVKLGTCTHDTKGETDLCIKTDLSLISVDETSDELSSAARKPLINCDEEECETVIMNPETMDLNELEDDIVHKKGASSKWTTGVVVGQQYIRQSFGQTFDGMILVKGTGNRRFAERGDSGSIIFRESTHATKNEIEVIGILVGGEIKMNSPKSPGSTNIASTNLPENAQNTSVGQENESRRSTGKENDETVIMCVVFEEALKKLQQNNPDIQTITFFKPH